MSHMVRAEMDLITVFSQSWGHRHDTSVAHENVETLRRGGELVGGLLHRGKRAEVAFYESEFDI